MANVPVPPGTDNECDFQELILQRKVERLEYLNKKKENWMQNLTRIKEMKSKNGIHPLAIFPKEIWMEIMDKSNPKDKWNMYQIHPTFSDLLENNKIRDVLFPQALAVMMNEIRNGQEYDLDIDGDDIINSDLAPLIRLRQVCKSLRDAVDRWFEEEHLRMLPNYQSLDQGASSEDTRFPQDQNRLTSMTFEMCSKEEVAVVRKARLKGLIQNFRIGATSSAKKLFLRSIQVEISSQNFEWHPDFNFNHDEVNELGESAFEMWERLAYTQIYEEFKSTLIDLLRLVGDQIWYFKLNIDPYKDFRQGLKFYISDYFILLQQCCELMPNLKRLDLCFYVENRPILRVATERPQYPLEMFPFPTMETLEKIVFEQGSHSNTLGVYNAILKANPQIKMMRYKGLSAAFEGISPGALKALKLESFIIGNNIDIDCDYYDTPPCTFDFDFNVWRNILQDFTWPLKDFQFRVKSVDSVSQVFRLLENFPTLETIAMRLEDMEIGNKVGFLNLPNLVDLELALSSKIEKIDYGSADVNQLFSLNFLLFSKKLRQFEWATYKSNDDHEATRIRFEDKKLLRFLKNREYHEKLLNFRGGMRDLTYSNVWDAFPELEFVTVSYCVTSEHLSSCETTYKAHQYLRRCHRVIKESKSDIAFCPNGSFGRGEREVI